jgi:hypothetical protein
MVLLQLSDLGEFVESACKIEAVGVKPDGIVRHDVENHEGTAGACVEDTSGVTDVDLPDSFELGAAVIVSVAAEVCFNTLRLQKVPEVISVFGMTVKRVVFMPEPAALLVGQRKAGSWPITIVTGWALA